MPETSETPLTLAEVRAAFSQTIRRIPVTMGYRIRLLGVLAGLALLQLLYVLLVVAVGWLTWLYTIAAFGSGIRLNALTILFYAGPPAAGVITVLFLLKPILIRPPRPPEPLRLMPQDDPVLFEFVDCLCRTLGSPRPSRIYADLRVNASAALHGWGGFFSGHLDLTIGLPLAAGLTLPQFTGVLAHEFGHFAQRAGLSSYFLIQSIQQWFARVVYQRDGWDEWLARQSDHGDWRIKFAARLAELVVTGSRKYLTVLMTIGNWLSSGFSRQMEFDADRYEAAIVGAEVFEATSLRLPVLACGANVVWQDAAKAWSVGRLPEDVAALVALRTELFPDETTEQIIEETTTQAAGRFDTHPSTADRIASVRRDHSKSVVQLEGPAQRLFRDFPSLCRRATLHHYKTILGVDTERALLVPAGDVIANTIAEHNFESAVRELFHAAPEFVSRWFRLPAAGPRQYEPACSDANAFDLEVETGAFTAAFETSALHFAALVIAQTGTKINPASFRLPDADVATVRRGEAASARDLRDMLDEYRQSTKFLAERIETTTARLLKTPVPDLEAAWRCYGALSRCQDDLIEVQRCLAAMQIVRGNAQVFPAAICANLLDDLERNAQARMKRIIDQTAESPAVIVFDPRSPATLGAQLTLAEDIQSFLSRAEALSTRALGQLAWFVLSSCEVTPEAQA
jgi:Zn-dependent protease with chaperone function